MTTLEAGDVLVTQPQPYITYIARREELRLVLKAQYPIRDANGLGTGLLTEGVVLPFRDGQLRIPLTGVVQTESGREVDVAEIHPALERHRLNGDRFEGFVKLEQSAPPMTAEEMKNLIRLGQNFDRAGIEAFIAQEQAGWNRAEVIESAQESLAGIARLEAEALEAAQAQQKKPKA